MGYRVYQATDLGIERKNKEMFRKVCAQGFDLSISLQ